MQTHGDSTWTTATGFITPNDLTDLVTWGNAHWATADLSSLNTLANKLNTTLEADGSVSRFTANALERAPTGTGGTSSLIVLPFSARVLTTGRVSWCPLVGYQYCALPASVDIYDDQGNAVDLSTKTLSLTAWLATDQTSTSLFELRSDGTSPALVVSGDSGNHVSITIAAEHTAPARKMLWRLYNVADKVAVCEGEIEIKRGAGPT
jgi:hypothetical protein